MSDGRSDSAPVSYMLEGGIALISVDNPPVNALSQAVRAGLQEAVERFEADKAAKVAVIYGTGRTFIAGADIREFGKPMQEPGLPEVVNTFENSDKPIVAAIHGTALGGGLETALGCHYRVALSSAKVGLPEVKLHFVELPGEYAADQQIAEKTVEWRKRFDREYCKDIKEQVGCLDKPLGKTNPELVAEELTIRRFETNLGNWLADLARNSFADQGAQIAFLNSGGMRLNQNIPAGSTMTRKQLDTLFAYPTRLVRIKITGAQLRQVLEHSVSDWTGNGHWLQISGLAFQHDPQGEKVENIHLMTATGPKPLADDAEIIAVVNDYLINSKGDRDGYTMLSEALLEEPRAQRPDLKDIVVTALKQAGEKGISPKRDGRICNIRDRQDCLVK